MENTIRYIVRCRVSGGVTGTRTAVLKSNGAVQYFATLAQAQERATHLCKQMNNEFAVAYFEYWAEKEGLDNSASAR